MSKKNILITGATSGIGWSIAKTLDYEGNQLILCGRRKERLAQLAKELSVPSLTLTFDVSDQKTVFDSFATIPKVFTPITVLINNAGNAHGLDSVQTALIEDWEAMIDSNLKGLLYVTKALLPQMLTAPQGQIINLGSIAAKETYPKGSVYCSSKAAVDSFTEGLRMDLVGENIRVGIIHPGMVETEFSLVRFKGDQNKADQVYKGLKPLTPEDVAHAIAFMIQAPPHMNVADMLLLPTQQASASIAHRGNNLSQTSK